MFNFNKYFRDGRENMTSEKKTKHTKNGLLYHKNNS